MKEGTRRTKRKPQKGTAPQHAQSLSFTHIFITMNQHLPAGELMHRFCREQRQLLLPRAMDLATCLLAWSIAISKCFILLKPCSACFPCVNWCRNTARHGELEEERASEGEGSQEVCCLISSGGRMLTSQGDSWATTSAPSSSSSSSLLHPSFSTPPTSP